MTAELILEQRRRAVAVGQSAWESWCLQLIRGEGGPISCNRWPFLKLDPRPARVVAVLALEEAEPCPGAELVHLLENPGRTTLVAINGLDEIVVLKPASSATASGSRRRSAADRQLLPHSPFQRLRIGVGDYFAGIPGLALSYQTAQGHPCAVACASRPASRSTSSRITGLPVLLGTLGGLWQADQLRAPC